MPRIFVSHASADHQFVQDFVGEVLLLGCGARQEEVFFSSGADIGVPIGADLNSFIRERISEQETLVVAMITPTFLARPYCLAELGAAWSRAGTLFPLTAPGMERETLGGVLGGIHIKPIDDRAALNQLSDRVADLLQRRSPAATWEMYRDDWLREIPRRRKFISPHGADELASVTSCSRDQGHMEVFWTDRSARVFYRWWLGDQGWSKVERLHDVEADHVAAVGGEGAEMLFGIKGLGEVWVSVWSHNNQGWMVAGAPRSIAGQVRGPLSALKRGPDVELFAWTEDGRPCHLWCDGEGWTSWSTDW
jgi:TIR domain